MVIDVHDRGRPAREISAASHNLSRDTGRILQPDGQLSPVVAPGS
jgi:hypothetical protein